MARIDLSGVPETMLWTLHNRASESLRADAFFRDPEAERIYRSIEYDYRGHFGRSDASHAVRSLMFDEALAVWLREHPDGQVVELGCGLETQFQRMDNGRVRWLCVDVPEAIEVRERFLPPGQRCRHLRCSALDTAWIEQVDPSRGVFVSAQGLLMYFREEQVRALLTGIVERLPGVELMFDTIPVWFSRMTLRERGLWRTRHYRVPPMPWGIAPAAIAPLLRRWSARVDKVEVLPYRRFRTFPSCLGPWMAKLPGLRQALPMIVRVTTRADGAS